MKLKFYILCLMAIEGFWIESCTPDFIEPNISGKSIQLLAPANGTQTGTETQTFWWTALTGAEQYNLEIVQGTFTAPTQLVLDTNVTTNKFTITLSPGKYQWRVEGINNGGNTPYSTFGLTIDTNTNMATQIIVLVSPANNSWSNRLVNIFKWDSIVGATSYMLQVINQANLVMVIDTIVKREPISLSLPADGKYTWQVRAQNNASNSPYTSYTIGIDTTTPAIPVLLDPRNDSLTLTTHFTLSWTKTSPPFSPVLDSLYIYSNSNMTSIIKDTLTSLSSYSDTLVAGTYYWRVRAIDAAGNKSSYSSLFSFTTQ